MVIVQYGQAKSGSSFIFQTLTDLLQNRFICWSDYQKNRNGFVPEKYHGDYVDIKENELSELIHNVPSHEFYMLKTHDAPGEITYDNIHDRFKSEKISKWLEDKELKVIATFRDPRDMCLSYFDHAEAHRRGEKDFFENKIFSPFDAVPNVKNEYQILNKWTGFDKIHWVSYPQICNQPFEVFEAMKKYIGLYNIDSTALIKKLLDNKSKIHQFNKGYADRWKKELNQEEGLRLTEILQSEIKQYNIILKRAELCISRI
jgi:hypothetical protein